MKLKENRIKILYTIPNFDTAGSGKAMLKIAERLDKTIFDPHIACFHDKGLFFKIVEQSGIPIHLIEYTSPLKPRIQLIKNAYKTSRFFRKNKFNIIHSFHYSADYSEPLAAKFAGVKWIFTKKNMSWGGSSANAWRIRSWLADGIAVQNTDMQKNFYPSSSKTYLIPRGVDTTEFYPRQATNDLKDELKIPYTCKIILSVANLVPVKGIEILISAFKKVENQNLFLLIAGDDKSEYANELKRNTAQDKNIIFTGKRSDIKDFHSIADLFVLPTLNKGRQEGSPVSLLEAMASGVPVLASNVAGIRDQLSSIPDQLFRPGDADELTGKLKILLNQPENDKEGLINAQLNIIKAKYTIEKEVANHQEFYLKVINGK